MTRSEFFSRPVPTNVAQALLAFTHLRNLDLMFHIDDDPAEVLNTTTHERVFTDTEAEWVRSLLQYCDSAFNTPDGRWHFADAAGYYKEVVREVFTAAARARAKDVRARRGLACGTPLKLACRSAEHHSASPDNDPAAIFAIATALYQAAASHYPHGNGNFSQVHQGFDQGMRACMAVGTAFETWANEHIDFDQLHEPWPCLLENNFGRALSLIGPASIATLIGREPEIAALLNLPVRSGATESVSQSVSSVKSVSNIPASFGTSADENTRVQLLTDDRSHWTCWRFDNAGTFIRVYTEIVGTLSYVSYLTGDRQAMLADYLDIVGDDDIPEANANQIRDNLARHLDALPYPRAIHV